MKFGSNLFKGLRSLEAEPQVARRNGRNSPLKPGVRPGFQSKHTKKKTVPFGTVFMSGFQPQESLAACGRRFFIIFG
ncbi:hypothetical protein [Butyricicoccus pullicaecorum]|uniref:hypothetical protein n=1 Tax=Butyricicoccus pullicaecorum TaxID=501571 RepID=UPI0039909C83